LEQIFEDVQKQYKTAGGAAEQYAAIEPADDPVWSGHTQSVREFISALRILGSKQVRSIILSGLKRFSPLSFLYFSNFLSCHRALADDWGGTY
jgi:hypothetical protein